MKQEEIDFSEQIKELQVDESKTQVDELAAELFVKKVDEAAEKFGIDVKSFYDNDPKPIIEELKEILVMWQEKAYPDDETRWKEYYEDILTLVHKRTYNSKFDG